MFGCVGSVRAIVASVAVVASLLPTQAADFSGLTIGLGIGGQFSSVDFDHVERNGASVELNREVFSVSPSSIAGGIHGGYQYQFGSFLLGIEGSYTAFSAEDSQFTNLNGFPRDREAKVRDQLGIVAKFGYVFGDLLAYGKVGLAASEIEFHNYRIDTGVDLGRSKTRVTGLLFGGGAEYAINSNMSIGIDYSVADYDVDHIHMRSPVTGQVFTTSNDNIDYVSHTVLGRLTYRFGRGERYTEPLK